MEINLDHMYDTAIRWTREAGEFIKKKMYESFSVTTKSNANDLVTDVDQAVERLFLEKLKATFPTHRLMGEEGSHKSIHDLNGVVWILDPIDGTINFVHQRCFFAISLGIFVEGKGKIGIVYDVMNDELFSAQTGKGAFINGSSLKLLPKDTSLHESLISVNTGWLLQDDRLRQLAKKARGVRNYGSAALEIAYVAANRLDAYVSFQLSPWDIAGGNIILEEVGGISSNYEGEELTFLQTDTYVAANPAIYKEIMKKVYVKI